MQSLQPVGTYAVYTPIIKKLCQQPALAGIQQVPAQRNDTKWLALLARGQVRPQAEQLGDGCLRLLSLLCSCKLCAAHVLRKAVQHLQPGQADNSCQQCKQLRGILLAATSVLIVTHKPQLSEGPG